MSPIRIKHDAFTIECADVAEAAAFLRAWTTPPPAAGIGALKPLSHVPTPSEAENEEALRGLPFHIRETLRARNWVLFKRYWDEGDRWISSLQDEVFRVQVEMLSTVRAGLESIRQRLLLIIEHAEQLETITKLNGAQAIVYEAGAAMHTVNSFQGWPPSKTPDIAEVQPK